MRQLPAHIIATSEGQTLLDLLDANLVIKRNTRLHAFEVWRWTLDEKGIDYGFIVRLERGQAPGEWLLTKLRARDSRYRPAEEAAQEVVREIRESEEAERKAQQDATDRKITEIAEEIAYDYRPEATLVADPHWTTRQRKAWDPAPVVFPTAKS